MATNYVHDTLAGQSISVWVIFRPEDWDEVAVVRAHRSKSGMVLVNVFNYAKSRSAKDHPFQYKRNKNGYLNDAMDGLWIDGHQLAGDAAKGLGLPDGGVGDDFDLPLGYALTGYNPRTGKWLRCYRKAWLDYLKDFGYRVIQAL